MKISFGQPCARLGSACCYGRFPRLEVTKSNSTNTNNIEGTTMNKRPCQLAAGVAAILIATAASANANTQNFSFTGNFTQDNTVQLFTFSVGAASPNVILETLSYAGGVNAAGQTIARGGFDPILAVFDSSGARIGQNDDGGSNVPADITGAHFDTYLSLGGLAAGTYTVSVMQYDNFSNGDLSAGFRHDSPSDAWFTRALTGHVTGGFYDVTGSQRDSHWAFDILNVEGAVVIPPGVADSGATLGSLATAFLALATLKRRLLSA
jgi:hypothetical protein